MPRRIYFYALRPDLLSVLSEMESKRSLRYTLCGGSVQPAPRSWAAAADIPDIGVADGSQHLTCQGYLISDSSTKISSRPVPLFNGTVQFDTDQSTNPDTILLIPGGERKGALIIAGGFSTLAASPVAQALIRLAVGAIKRQFTRVNAFWVGPEALARFRHGMRLCYAEQSPSEYDLRDQAPATAP